MSEALAAALSADLEIVLRLFCGMLAGIVVGWERTAKQSYAGIRTFGLVGLGTATASAIFSANTEGDEASRVVQGILTGVGFLGAGVITIARKTAEIKAGESGGPEKEDREMHARGPSGLTTAAAIWVTAALGCAAGLGDFHLAIIGAGLALVLLVVDHSIERLAGRRQGT